jgi:hypothetical protein
MAIYNNYADFAAMGKEKPLAPGGGVLAPNNENNDGTNNNGNNNNSTKNSKSNNGSNAMGIAAGAIGAAGNVLSQLTGATQEVEQNAQNMQSSINNKLGQVNNLDTSSLDAFVDSSSMMSGLNHTTFSNVYGRSAGDDILGNLQASIQGAQAGAAGGPWTMAASAAAGSFANLFSRAAARKKARDLTKQLNAAVDAGNALMAASTDRAAHTASMTDFNNLMNNAVLAAYGGPINMKYTGINSPFGNRFNDGGINIKEENKGKFTALANTHGMTPLQMANHIFANKDNYSSTQIKRANFVRNAAKWHAEGGNLDNQFSDFRNGVIEYNAGGTHEENPNDGVQVGVDPQGTPNLVEEGEVNYNDYIFSDRLKVPKQFRKQYGLGTSKKQMTYADAAKKLQKESEERPLDPISKRGLDSVLGALAESQEDTRFKKQMQDPQFRQQVMQSMAQQQAEQQAMQQQPSEEEMMAMQQQAAEQGQPFAYGGRKGNMFDGTGDKSQKVNSFAVPIPKIVDEMNYYDNPVKLDFTKMMDYLNTPIPAANVNTNLPYYRDNTNQKQYYNAGKYTHNNITEKLKSGYAIGDPNTVKYINTLAEKIGISTKDLMDNFDSYRLRQGDAVPEGINAKPGNGYVSADIPDAISYDHQQFNPYNLPHTTENSDKVNKDKDKETESDFSSLTGLPTWLRYAPIAASAMGLFSKPDYKNANALQDIVANNVGYTPIEGNYIGDYLRYNPYDVNYNANQIRQQGNAQLRNIINNSGGNRAAAMANMAVTNYNTQLAMSDLFRKAQEYNDAQQAKVGEFNRGTNQYNATMANQIAQFNAGQRAKAQEQYINGMTQALQWKEAQKAAADQAKSNAISAIGNSLGDIGRENFAANQQLGLIASGYYGAINPDILPLILKNNGINPKSKVGKQFIKNATTRWEEQREYDKEIREANKKKNKSQSK